MNHNTDNQEKALETTKVLYIVLKFHELWSTNRNGVFFPPSVNSAFCFIASFCTDVREQNSTKL